MSTELTFESRIIHDDLLNDDILALVLDGDLNSTTTPEFDAEVSKHLDQGRSRIIIDCRRLGYLSSLGIGSLITLQTRLKRKGGSVNLAALQGPVAAVIRAVRLDKVLGIYGDLETARKSFYE